MRTMESAADLAFAYLSQGKFSESEPLAREAINTTTRKLPGGWERFSALTLLGASLSGQKKFEAAEPPLLEGYRGLETLKGGVSVLERSHVERTREWIVELYQAWGKLAKVADWRKD